MSFTLIKVGEQEFIVKPPTRERRVRRDAGLRVAHCWSGTMLRLSRRLAVLEEIKKYTLIGEPMSPNRRLSLSKPMLTPKRRLTIKINK